MVVVVAGCLPRAGPEVPADVLTAFGHPGEATILFQAPPAAATGQDVVAALEAENGRWYSGRAVPVFGLVDCHGFPSCRPGPGGMPGGPARTVWLVLYPECTDRDGNGVGWAVVDATNGIGGGYMGGGPC